MNGLISVCMLIAMAFHPAPVHSRIHNLILESDAREQITISTFGFLKNGFLQVNVKQLSFSSGSPLPSTSFAFILERTQNGGFSSFTTNEKNRDFCSFLIKHQELARKSGAQDGADDLQSFLANDTDFSSHSYSLLIFRLNLSKDTIDVILFGKNMGNLKISARLDDSKQPDTFFRNETLERVEKVKNERQLNKIKMENSNNQTYSFKFQIDVKSSVNEGLYILNFFNCFQPHFDQRGANIDELKSEINLNLELIEKNDGSYLSAGEIPVATLYLTWSIIYFLGGISWMYILKSGSRQDVFKIHYLMLTLAFIKSMSLTFHAINIHYIAVNGIHEAIWAILFYITYVLRGLLLIISILLVGTGWTFIKSILSENERRLFVIVIPLQILATTAYIFFEEKEEGDVSFVTWRQLFFLLDLLCCGAILIPVVWSIKHLEQASATDGKMAINLKKLKIFKHFYMMVICYVYFTRIIGFLLKQVLPFRYEWFDELCTEIVTFTFFAMTAYKFQPASNNPYLQLSQDEVNGGDGGRSEEGGGGEGAAEFSGNTEMVMDLIEHNYSSQRNLIDVDGGGSKFLSNSTLFSRKQQNSPV
jgi:hypothetical protein